KLFDLRSHAQELSEMSAGRSAGSPNEGRIDFVSRGICAQPSNCGLHIVHGGRKLVFWREAIADCGGDKTVLSQGQAKLVVTVPMPSPEAPAMNTQNRW